MKTKTLVISTCSNKLHEKEFVRPIQDIIKESEVINFKDLKEKSLEKYSHIIISGTALKDFEYLSHLDKFNWIKNTNKSVLGICSGAQIIAQVSGEELKDETEIGLIKVNINEEDKILESVDFREIYSLHKKTFESPKKFKVILENKIPQLIKHKEKKVYACLFHPEVRNKKLIENFSKL